MRGPPHHTRAGRALRSFLLTLAIAATFLAIATMVVLAYKTWLR